MGEIMIELSVDVDEIQHRLGVLADKSGEVIARAVNRSYPTGKSAIAKETRKRYYVTAKDINDGLNITKATAASPTAKLNYTGKHKNLYLWNRQRAVTPNVIIHWPQGRGGSPNVKVYKASVARGHSKLSLLGDNKPFIQRVRSGEKGEFVGLFRRVKDGKRGKNNIVGLESVQAPAIPQIIKNEEVMAQFRRATGPMLQKRLEHEIDVVLKGVVR